LPNNKVNTNYNGQCSEKEHFVTSGGQIWLINKAVHPMTSSRESRQVQLGSRKSPSPWGIAQLAIQKEPCGWQTTRNSLLRQWTEREMDWGLCWERETAGSRKQVEDAEAVIRPEQEDTEAAENAGLTTTEPKKTFHEIIVAIGDSLSDVATSDDGGDWDDEDDEETEQCQLSEDNEPCWVMSTITKTVQQCMERFQQKQIKLDKLTQPGWEDAANYSRERDKKYGKSELRVPAVVQLQTDDDAASSTTTPVGQLMVCLDIDPGTSQMPQGTTRPGSSHISLCSGEPQSNTRIPGFAPSAEPDSSPFLIATPAEPVSLYPCISPPQLVAI